MAIEGPARNGNSVDLLKVEPSTGISNGVVIGGGHQGAGDAEGDGVVFALPAKHHVSEEEPAHRHVNDGGIHGATSFGPGREEGLCGVSLAVGFGP